MTLFPKLIDILLKSDDEVSCKAAWVFEFICAENIYAVVPYFDVFTKNLKYIHLDSAVRPVAKVCSLIAKTYFSKQPNVLRKALKPIHQENIIEACFDWMISNQKVAAKVYAMETLFQFGKKIDWIHPELIQILEQDYNLQSAAYKARARSIIRKIKKSKT